MNERDMKRMPEGSKHYIRVNGVGNAWPVPLGTVHPFYDPGDPEQLANVSFSILKLSSDPVKGTIDPQSIEWEVLIDAGHGIVQYLIRHGNRMPDAVVLTHAHLDHTLSLDWIIQSFYRLHGKEKRMPLYASRQGWDFFTSSFPQLPQLIDYHELKPGEKRDIEGIPGLELTPLPVYHGEKAPGPNMLVFEIGAPGKDPARVLFSGDLMCPLLRRADYRYLQEAGMAFLDANNRFPYTASNHWSICSEGPEGRSESKYLKAWRQQLSCTHLVAPHLPVVRDRVVHAYFDEFLAYCDENMPLSVFDLCSRIRPLKTMLVHYSGMEDKNHNGGELLNPVQLENWANAEAERRGIASEFTVPRPGDLFEVV
jgi:glyoxylase-like metal-dependent hydrolase (beta-lactamase superfamily II)